MNTFGLRPRARLWFQIAPETSSRTRMRADVAQLVEHHLAKVRVAGSNPVVRSERVSPIPAGSSASYSTGASRLSRWSGREARQRTANPCTRVQIPSPPRAIGAAVARFPDTEEVTGSIPVSPTSKTPSQTPITALVFDSASFAPEPAYQTAYLSLGRGIWEQRVHRAAHHGSARPQFLAVDPLRDVGARMADQMRDVLDRHARARQQRHEAVSQLARGPRAESSPAVAATLRNARRTLAASRGLPRAG